MAIVANSTVGQSDIAKIRQLYVLTQIMAALGLVSAFIGASTPEISKTTFSDAIKFKQDPVGGQRVRTLLTRKMQAGVASAAGPTARSGAQSLKNIGRGDAGDDLMDLSFQRWVAQTQITGMELDQLNTNSGDDLFYRIAEKKDAEVAQAYWASLEGPTQGTGEKGVIAVVSGAVAVNSDTNPINVTLNAAYSTMIVPQGTEVEFRNADGTAIANARFGYSNGPAPNAAISGGVVGYNFPPDADGAASAFTIPDGALIVVPGSCATDGSNLNWYQGLDSWLSPTLGDAPRNENGNNQPTATPQWAGVDLYGNLAALPTAVQIKAQIDQTNVFLKRFPIAGSFGSPEGEQTNDLTGDAMAAMQFTRAFTEADFLMVLNVKVLRAWEAAQATGYFQPIDTAASKQSVALSQGNTSINSMCGLPVMALPHYRFDRISGIRPKLFRFLIAKAYGAILGMPDQWSPTTVDNEIYFRRTSMAGQLICTNRSGNFRFRTANPSNWIS